MNDLRDAPTSIGRSSAAANSGNPRQHTIAVRWPFGKPQTGVDDDPLHGNRRRRVRAPPPRPAPWSLPARDRRTPPRHTSRPAARACASATSAAPVTATARRQRGVALQAAHVVDHGRAGSEAAAATSALDVSTETGTRSLPSQGGQHRQHAAPASSSADTDSAPGRVDSPPMSIRSAPSASMRNAAAYRDRRIQTRRRVGKRVGGDVENAHHEAALAKNQRATMGDGKGVDGAKGETSHQSSVISRKSPVGLTESVRPPED